MATAVLDLLKGVRERTRKGHSRTGRGIGVASDYVRTLEEISRGGQPYWKLFKIADAKRAETILKTTRSKLVFRNSECLVLGGKGKKDAGGGVSGERFGRVTKDLKLTPKSIMDFECVLTSIKQDRDGDILEPAGAELDEKMPLLWQHVPVEPIGKFVRLVDRDDDRIKVHFAIADTALGRDAATLIEFGALRISHGFVPKEFEPLGESEEDGFRITSYLVMEGSAVSIPSNTDAGIEAWSREKLHHPLAKSFYRRANELRKKTVPTGGAIPTKSQPVINVTVNVDSAGRSGTARKGYKSKFNVGDRVSLGGSTTYEVVEVDEADPGHEGDPDYETMYRIAELGGDGRQLGSTLRVPEYKLESAKSHKPRKGKGKKEEDEEETDDDEDEDEEEETSTEDEPETTKEEEDEETPEEETSEGDEEPDPAADRILLGDVADKIAALASDASLPREAQQRLEIVGGMLEDVQTNLEEYTTQLQEAASDQDVAGIFSSVENVIDGVVSRLTDMVTEIDTLRTVDGMEEGALAGIQEIDDSVATVMTHLASLSGAVQEAEAEADAADNHPEPDGDEMSGGDSTYDAETMDVTAEQDTDHFICPQCGEDAGKEEICPTCGIDLTDPANFPDEKAEEDDEEEEAETEEKSLGDEYASITLRCNGCGKVDVLTSPKEIRDYFWRGEPAPCSECGSTDAEMTDSATKDADSDEEDHEEEIDEKRVADWTFRCSHCGKEVTKRAESNEPQNYPDCPGCGRGMTLTDEVWSWRLSSADDPDTKATPYYSVEELAGEFLVVDPEGGDHGTFGTREEAQAEADRLNASDTKEPLSANDDGVDDLVEDSAIGEDESSEKGRSTSGASKAAGKLMGLLLTGHKVKASVLAQLRSALGSPGYAVEKPGKVSALATRTAERLLGMILVGQTVSPAARSALLGVLSNKEPGDTRCKECGSQYQPTTEREARQCKECGSKNIEWESSSGWVDFYPSGDPDGGHDYNPGVG